MSRCLFCESSGRASSTPSKRSPRNSRRKTRSPFSCLFAHASLTVDWCSLSFQLSRLSLYACSEERKRIVLDRAIRLREARKISAERQEAARREREEALKRYQERLAIAQRRRESLHAVEDRQVNAAVHDLIEESSSWITLENMNEKITEELFNTPGASTGYKTVQSHLWKYQTYVNSFHRMFTDSTYFANNTPEMAEAQRVEQKEEGKEVMHRVLLENFLNTLISTGEERAKFRNLIEDFSKFSAENDAWSEVDQMIDTATENPSKDEDGSQDGGVVNTTSRDFRSRGRGGSRGSAGGKRRGA